MFPGFPVRVGTRIPMNYFSVQKAVRCNLSNLTFLTLTLTFLTLTLFLLSMN